MSGSHPKPPVSPILRQSLRNDFCEALGWLRDLGVEYANTRFDKYERDLNRLVGHDDGKIPMPIDGYDTSMEASDLVFIHRGLRDQQLGAFRTKLQMFVGGPVHSSHERPGGRSSLARNTGLELVLASMFAMAGFRVGINSPCDIVAFDDKTRFHIECKRPYKLQTVKKCLQKAYSQLKRSYEHSDGKFEDRGLAVLSISRYPNPDTETLRVQDELELNAFIDQFVRDFVEENKPLFYRELHDKTMGVLAYFQIPVSLASRRGTLILRQVGGIYLSNIHSVDIKDLHPDRVYFREIMDRLNTGPRSIFSKE